MLHSGNIEPDFTLVDEAAHRGHSRTAAYHAVCWAARQTDVAIEQEIARCSAFRDRAWNEVGSGHADYSRVQTLKRVLAIRREPTQTTPYVEDTIMRR